MMLLPAVKILVLIPMSWTVEDYPASRENPDPDELDDDPTTAIGENPDSDPKSWMMILPAGKW